MRTVEDNEDDSPTGVRQRTPRLPLLAGAKVPQAASKPYIRARDYQVPRPGLGAPKSAPTKGPAPQSPQAAPPVPRPIIALPEPPMLGGFTETTTPPAPMPRSPEPAPQRAAKPDWAALKEDLDLGRAGADLTAGERKDIAMLAALGRAPLREWSADALNGKLHYRRRSKAVQSLIAAGVPVSSLGHHIRGVLQALDAHSTKEHEARMRREAAERGISLGDHLRQLIKEHDAPRTWRNNRTGQTARASRTQVHSLPRSERSNWTEVAR